MAKAVEINKRQIRERSTVRQVAKHVLLTAALGVGGYSVSTQASEKLPGIESKMDQDNAILDHLQLAGKSAAFSEATENVGPRGFSVGYHRPNMRLVEGNTRVARLLAKIKGGSEPIEVELQRVIDSAPGLGKELGDTTELQKTISRVAGQVNDEVEALNDRQNRNLFVKWLGGLGMVAYPTSVLGAFGLERRRKQSSNQQVTDTNSKIDLEDRKPKRIGRRLHMLTASPSERIELKQEKKSADSNTGEGASEVEIDVDLPGWMAKDLARRGKL
jgi:hypothetical protein